MLSSGTNRLNCYVDEVKVPDGDHSHIVGGHSASISLYPYVVAFEKNGLFWCAATIIGSDWSITAAHCFDKCLVQSKCAAMVKCKIRAGSSKMKRRGFLFDVVEVIPHENYSEKAKDVAYDLAVLKVNKPFLDASKRLIPVNLPDEDYNLPDGTMVTVMGWGKTHEEGEMANELQQIKVPIVAHDICERLYGHVITSHMICAGYPEGKKDACQADSGGPMIVNHTLVGLVAFGEGCARPDRPGVYISVASFREWIKENAGV